MIDTAGESTRPVLPEGHQEHNTMPQRGLEFSQPSISFVQLADSVALRPEGYKTLKAVMIVE
jgi:hypothetical protein